MDCRRLGAAIMAIGMAPIEVIGKIVKPFALAVRLFGNMTAGHFVILSLFGIIFIFGKIDGLTGRRPRSRRRWSRRS